MLAPLQNRGGALTHPVVVGVVNVHESGLVQLLLAVASPDRKEEEEQGSTAANGTVDVGGGRSGRWLIWDTSVAHCWALRPHN